MDGASEAIDTTGRARLDSQSSASNQRPRVRLGEELPLFCERCGYSLHGLTQTRCERCDVLHFSCPECGHHQPINTLRPAMQKFLGRLSALGLVVSVFLKLNFFGWLLVAWCAMGYEWSYAYVAFRDVDFGNGSTGSFPEFESRAVDAEAIFAFALFAIPFGLVGRLLLLRWRRGWLVGLALGVLVALAVVAGIFLRRWEYADSPVPMPPPSGELYLLALLGAACVLGGAVIAWPVWYAVAHVFLPTRAARALLDWQRSLPNRESALSRV